MLRFKYLGRIMSQDDNDVPTMRGNLKRAWATWGRVSKILTRQEVPAPVAGMFYQAVVATVLLYGSESWVLPPSALKVLEGFHVEATRRMTGMRPQRRTVGPWVFSQVGRRPRGGAPTARGDLHPPAPTSDSQNHRGPDPTGGVQGGGEAKREFKPPVLVAAGDDLGGG